MRGRRAITRVSEGWLRVPGFPLTAERPLYSELVDTTLASDTRIRTAPTQYLYYSTIIQDYAAARHRSDARSLSSSFRGAHADRRCTGLGTRR